MANGDPIPLDEIEVTAPTATPGAPGPARHFDEFLLPPMPLTVAVVVIDGMRYWEWTSVSVRLALQEDPLETFRFTCTEQTPFAESWAFLRIRPGQKCAIYLDGELAISGSVVERQVAYDATQHVVEIQGQGDSGILGDTTAKLKTNEFKNITLQELANALSASSGVRIQTLGKLPDFKFPRVSLTTETVREALEKYSRQVGVLFGPNKFGALTLAGPGAFTSGPAQLIEGRNILIGREVLHSKTAATSQGTFSQAPGNDDQRGGDPTHGRHVEGSNFGTPGLTLPKTLRQLGEIPGWTVDMLKNRQKFEAKISADTEVTVTITQLGWQRPTGGLWRPWDTVFVDSPMLIMNEMLVVKAVTFTQDNQNGTRATPELKREEDLSRGRDLTPQGQ